MYRSHWKSFFPYKGLPTMRYEAGQFLLTIIYTICTWIKINILYGQKSFLCFVFSLPSWTYVLYSSFKIPVFFYYYHLLRRSNCVKCTQPLWCIIYISRTHTTAKISFPHNCLYNLYLPLWSHPSNYMKLLNAHKTHFASNFVP